MSDAEMVELSSTDESPTDMDIAIGVPMYSREIALERLLQSVPEYVRTVYVADNGPDQDRELYERDWPFSLEVLHLPHDCGIGKCRSEIVTAAEEHYLWVGDSDMEFTSQTDLIQLQAILDANPNLGGVAGWLVEDNVVRAGARDLKIVGDCIIKTADKQVMEFDPLPFARFDFIPQCALFRTAVFDSYSYDADMRSTEHVDFFMGQLDAGQWEFASTPTVMIQHNRNIDRAYRNSERGRDHVDTDLLQSKWGCRDTLAGPCADWGYLRGKTIPEQAFGVFKRATPARVWVPAKRGLEEVLR